MTTKQDALFDGPDDVDPVEKAVQDLKNSRAIAKLMGPGPVYQGVNKTIARLTASGKKYGDLEQLVDPIQQAGTIAATRAAARAVDQFTGHNPTGWHANGRDLAPLLERLEQLLLKLDPNNDADPLDAWLRDESAPREESPNAPGEPTSPHPAV